MSCFTSGENIAAFLIQLVSPCSCIDSSKHGIRKKGGKVSGASLSTMPDARGVSHHFTAEATKEDSIILDSLQDSDDIQQLT